MAAGAKRSTDEVRRDLELERDRLAQSLATLRSEVGKAADVGGRLKARLPLVAAGAAGAGFLLAGGVGATLRYVGRRGRAGHEQVRAGRRSRRDRG